MQTVVARFHHQSRDPSEIEQRLLAKGARDAAVTGYVVAMSFDGDSHGEAAVEAQRVLDAAGATSIKIIKREGTGV